MRLRQAAGGAAVEEPIAITDPVDWSLRAARYRWAELLRRIFEVDALVLPRFRDDAYRLCGLKQKLDLHSLEREHDSTALRSAKHTRIEKRGDVSVHGLHVSAHTPRSFTNGHRPRAAERLEEFPSLGGEHFP